MEEEYIYPNGISSYDVEACAHCLQLWFYEEIHEYEGENICPDCIKKLEGSDERQSESVV